MAARGQEALYPPSPTASAQSHDAASDREAAGRHARKPPPRHRQTTYLPGLSDMSVDGRARPRRPSRSSSVGDVRLLLEPDTPPALGRALARLLEREGLLGATSTDVVSPWRGAALHEGVAGAPDGSSGEWRRRDSAAYDAAGPPRSTRGATRA